MLRPAQNSFKQREYGFMAIQRVSRDRVGALLFVGQECFDDINEPRGASAVNVVPGSLSLLQLACLTFRCFPTALFGRPAGLLAILVGLIPYRAMTTLVLGLTLVLTVGDVPLVQSNHFRLLFGGGNLNQQYITSTNQSMAV
jgi:hypothetical protein